MTVTTDEPIDATVVEDGPEPMATHDVAPSTSLVRRAVTHEVIRPLDAAEVVASMRSHQELLRQILDPSDWQGNPDAQGSFVKKSGWRKIALAYNLALGRVSEDVERDPEGVPQRATYTAWAEAPNGRRVESSGHCAYSESRFSGPRGNVTKLENDMRATAETRAKNRAISDLIGMGKVSAEEVDAGAGGGGPAFGPPAEGDALTQMRKALAYLIGVDAMDAQVGDVLGKIEKAAGAPGYIPLIAARGVGYAAGAVKAAREGAPEPAPDPEPAAAPATGPPSGSVPMPDLSTAQTRQEATQILKDAGCICPDPMDTKTFDAACPLADHGVPF